MCGISAIFGGSANKDLIRAMVGSLHHRGPDDSGTYVDAGKVALGHNRLAILDLSDAGHQPAISPDGRYLMVFNGELYNYQELRRELPEYRFTSSGDTEVVLAAWLKWGEACLDRFLGMFAFIVYDTVRNEATAVRDRFGVKPLYMAVKPDGSVLLASEIKSIHAAGVSRSADLITWSTFLATGRHELPDRTFWEGVVPVPAGCLFRWGNGRMALHRWYDLAARVGEEDDRGDEIVASEWLDLALESVSLRFRSDVPVGVNLSGGVDSSFLLSAIHKVQGVESEVDAYTFITGDPNYDELPWVNELLAHTKHPSIAVRLLAEEVPDLAASVAHHQDEPFGGLPTLAYAKIFEEARSRGTIVLLDGQGLDEQWGGYDYYRRAVSGEPVPIVQGSKDTPTRPDALRSGLSELVLSHTDESWSPLDPLRRIQVRDLTETKIPRALRYNDRVSMRSSCELREPFLDHRLVELALRQPVHRKLNETTGKVFLRRILADYLPSKVVEAPKRPLQTPQREWLRGGLAGWASEMIDAGLDGIGAELLDPDKVQSNWKRFRDGEGDNSYFVWQWISLGIAS